MDEQSHVVSEYPRESANKFTASWGPLAGPLFLGRILVVKMATTGTLFVLSMRQHERKGGRITDRSDGKFSWRKHQITCYRF
jgi:hypothetical protein